MNYLKIIKKAKNIALFSHSSPDPDTVGSVVAFYNALLKMGKNVNMFCEDSIPESYEFLKETIKFNEKSFNKQDYDLLVAIDVAGEHMLGKFQEDFDSHENTLRLDHHIKGELEAKTNVGDVPTDRGRVNYAGGWLPQRLGFTQEWGRGANQLERRIDYYL